MIAGIVGTAIQKNPTSVLVETPGGVIYDIHISLHTSSRVEAKKSIRLLTTLTIREDAWQLHGFLESSEKEMFDTLIKINGVGPKVAMAVCSTFTLLEFLQITQSQDVTMLKKVPGIGPKSANRIMVELANFTLPGEVGTVDHTQKEAFMALEALGFKSDAIQKALRQCQADDTAELIKQALKIINS